MNRLKNRIAIVSLILMALSMVGCQQSTPLDLEARVNTGNPFSQNPNSSFPNSNPVSQFPNFNFSSGGSSSNSNSNSSSNGNSNTSSANSCNNSNNLLGSPLVYWSQYMVAMCQPLIGYLSEAGIANGSTCQSSFNLFNNQLTGQQCSGVTNSIRNLLSPQGGCRDSISYLVRFVSSPGNGSQEDIEAGENCLSAIRHLINQL